MAQATSAHQPARGLAASRILKVLKQFQTPRHHSARHAGDDRMPGQPQPKRANVARARAMLGSSPGRSIHSNSTLNSSPPRHRDIPTEPLSPHQSQPASAAHSAAHSASSQPSSSFGPSPSSSSSSTAFATPSKHQLQQLIAFLQHRWNPPPPSEEPHVPHRPANAMASRGTGNLNQQPNRDEERGANAKRRAASPAASAPTSDDDTDNDNDNDNDKQKKAKNQSTTKKDASASTQQVSTPSATGSVATRHWLNMLSLLDVDTCDLVCRRVAARILCVRPPHDLLSTEPAATQQHNSAPTAQANEAAAAGTRAATSAPSDTDVNIAVTVATDVPALLQAATLPTAHVVCILRRLVLPMCMTLSATPSRALQRSVHAVTAAAPQAAVDGIIAPVIAAHRHGDGSGHEDALASPRPPLFSTPHRVLLMDAVAGIGMAAVAQDALSRIAAAVVHARTALCDASCQVLE